MSPWRFDTHVVLSVITLIGSRVDMDDVGAKLSFLARYADTVTEVALCLPDAFHARCYSRALFLSIDSFLKFAPYEKNRRRDQRRLSGGALKELELTLHRLRRDYDKAFDVLRDKVTAHQQRERRDVLLKRWHELDHVCVQVLRDDMVEVVEQLSRAGSRAAFTRDPDVTHEAMRTALATTRPPSDAVVGIDRFATTRSGTVAAIPCSTAQEKAARAFTCIEGLTTLSTISHATQHCATAHRATWDLLVLDLTNLIETVFVDTPVDPTGAADDCLLTLWSRGDYGGVPRLRAFSRDLHLEQHLVHVRNKACAHIDAKLHLRQIEQLFLSLDTPAIERYFNSLAAVLLEACSEDPLTRPLCAHGRELKGITGSGEGYPFAGAVGRTPISG